MHAKMLHSCSFYQLNITNKTIKERGSDLSSFNTIYLQHLPNEELKTQ